jgi:hypothetical protein
MEDATALPVSFAAGATVLYRRTLADYPADDGWSLTLWIQGVEFDATPDGSTFVVELAADDTADLTPGAYRWVERVSKDGKPYDVGWGTVTIEQNPETATAADGMSWQEKALIAVRAKIVSRIAVDQSSYTFYQVAAAREELAELRRTEADLAAQVAAIRRGGVPRDPMLAAFTTPGLGR